MVKRSTVVMLVVLALVVGLYWYGQQPNNAIKKMITAGGTATPEEFGLLISPNLQVSGFTLEKVGGQSLSIQKENDVWMVTAGHKELANQEAADSAVRQVQALQIVAKVAAAPDLAAFGLSQPDYLLTVNFADGQTLILKIGNQTVTQTGYYLLKDNSTVIVIEKYGVEDLTALLDSPPFVNTPTPAAASTTESPTTTPTAEYTQTALPELTATKTP
jgi:hypothetical protein